MKMLNTIKIKIVVGLLIKKIFDKQKFEKLLIKLSTKKNEYLTKKINLEKLNYHNTWKNVNQKILEIFNEN